MSIHGPGHEQPLGGRGVPVPVSRSALFRVVLAVLAVSHALMAASWWSRPSPARVDGVSWVAGWMTPHVIAGVWVAAAVLAALGLVLSVVRGEAARPQLIVIGSLLVIIPLLIGALFLGPWLLWESSGLLGFPAGSGGGAGGPPHVSSGWGSTANYWTRAVMTLLALAAHAGAFDHAPRFRAGGARD